jgi:hypothetical protein
MCLNAPDAPSRSRPIVRRPSVTGRVANEPASVSSGVARNPIQGSPFNPVHSTSLNNAGSARSMPHPPLAPMQNASMHPVTANAGTGGLSWCTGGKCVPAPSVAPPKPAPSRSGSGCGPLQPGATAVPECSSGAPPSSPPSSGTRSAGPKNNVNQPQPAASATAPPVADLFDAFKNELNPLPSAEAAGDIHCNNGTTAWRVEDCSSSTQSSSGAAAAPGKSSTVSQLADSGASLLLKPDKVAAKIEECKTGKCRCSSFAVSKVTVIRFYPICEEECHQDTDCFGKCRVRWTKYNDDANEYNRLSKKTCPQNYSDD